jgi:hypothetical protein
VELLRCCCKSDVSFDEREVRCWSEVFARQAAPVSNDSITAIQKRSDNSSGNNRGSFLRNPFQVDVQLKPWTRGVLLDEGTGRYFRTSVCDTYIAHHVAERRCRASFASSTSVHPFPSGAAEAAP